MTSDGHFIEGYATTFDNVYYVAQDQWHERVRSQAFDKSIVSGQPVESRYNHSPDHVLGRSDLGTVQIWKDENGIRYRTKYNPADPDHQKVKAKIESGLIRGSSVAMYPHKVRWSNEGGKHILNIEEATLAECGPVNNPCNIEAVATVRSESDKESIDLQQSYKDWLYSQNEFEKLDSLFAI